MRNTYDVTPEGLILSKRNGKPMKPYLAKGGYLRVGLWDGLKTRGHLVHRLVAEKYLPNPDGLATVDHIDGDITNNNASNLQWMTGEDNTIKGRAKTWSLITPEGLRIEIYNLNQFCKNHKISAGNLCSRGKTKGWILC